MPGSPALRRTRSLIDVVAKAAAPKLLPETGWVIVGETVGAGTSTVIVPFLNSWTHHDSAETTYAKFQFYMAPDGEVRFRGAVTGGASGTVVCNLPKQYRPAKEERFDIPTTDGSRAIVAVQADGNVIILHSAAHVQGNLSRRFAIALG